MFVAQGFAWAFALLGMLPGGDGHGFLVFPPLRGGTAGKPANQYCPHCGNGAGICGDGGQWGGSSDFLGSGGSPVAAFKPGEIVELIVEIRAHHRGHFEFSICDQQIGRGTQNAQACLDRHKLQRVAPPSNCVPNDSRGDCQPVHEEYPERWYLPPNSGIHKMRFKIPEGLQCSSCTMQWRWWTANSCVPAPDYGCYFSRMEMLGWNAKSWCGTMCGSCSSSMLQVNSSARSMSSRSSTRGCGEEFRNCADISVMGSVVPSPAPSPAPVPSPSPVPSQQPTPTPKPAPTPSPVTCTPLFDCGSESWCDQAGFINYCLRMGASGQCPAPLCKDASEPEPEVESEPEPEVETEPEPEMEPELAPNTCQPTNSAYRLYCADESAKGQCPAPYCEEVKVATLQAGSRRKSSRRTSFLGPAFLQLAHALGKPAGLLVTAEL